MAIIFKINKIKTILLTITYCTFIINNKKYTLIFLGTLSQGEFYFL